jgi:pimeloyl-ACP methyl ester carboxylesterase
VADVPLVLLAGMNCTDDLWTGCGLDDALTPRLTEESMRAQVDRLLTRLPPVFVLGGLSLGAIVAMAIAVREPSRVAGLCLVSTNAKAPTPGQLASWQDWIARLDAGESARQLQATILDRLLSPHAASRPDLVERALAMGDGTGGAALRAQLRMQATRSDLRPGLSRIGVPALVVSGASDALCPPSFHTEIAGGMRDARMVTLEGGHLLPMERPSAFGALVRSWRAGLN